MTLLLALFICLFIFLTRENYFNYLKISYMLRSTPISNAFYYNRKKFAFLKPCSRYIYVAVTLWQAHTHI